jgi:hypothetical protein
LRSVARDIPSSRIDPLATRQESIDFNTLPADQMTGEFIYTGDDEVTRAVSAQLVPEINIASH